MIATVPPAAAAAVQGPPSNRSPHTPGAVKQPQFLRSYDAIRADLLQIAKEHPDIVQVRTIGSSWETAHGLADRPILDVRLTSPDGSAQKPSSVWISGVHATETANPELMVKFIREAAEGYGKDAELTGLLRSRELHIVPMVNPDGHHVVEDAYRDGDRSNMIKRKNTDPPHGVDLNRNYGFHWGLDDTGSSPHQGSGRYRGTGPFSEPETQAVAGLVRDVRPGLFIDWHSPGKDVLYPFGDTKQPAPDAAGLRAVAESLARRNGYVVEAASQYSTSQGTSDDWAYGAMGIPAVTVETGTTSRLHDSQFRGAWRDNEPAMRRAGWLADAAFARASAPTVARLSVGPVRGTFTAPRRGEVAGDRITAVEAFTDPATRPGEGVQLRAADGAFDSGSERALGSIRQLGAAQGADLVYVRARGADGTWGTPMPQWLDGRK
jgi:hypothetical protein